MPYVTRLSLDLDRTHPFPYNVPAIRFARDLELSAPVTFLVGDNGTGKSTLLETLAVRLGLANMSGAGYGREDFAAARALAPQLRLERGMDRDVGFFFRAEDFSEYLSGLRQNTAAIRSEWRELEGEVPEHIIREMERGQNYARYEMNKQYGQDLHAFSHGEAYLQIIAQRVRGRGIYLFDEPEAALSPAKQLMLMQTIRDHLATLNSQFIIATHSPVLMGLPGARLYEITADGMEATDYESTEHYRITKGFLNYPELYLGEGR